MEEWGGIVDFSVLKALSLVEEGYMAERVQQVSDENEGISVHLVG